MFSDFFSNASDDIFFTNAMYAGFLEEVIATINIYNPKEKITIDIYESKVSKEENRELAIIGFRSYVNSLSHKKWLGIIDGLVNVSVFFLLGVFFIYFIYHVDFLTDWLFCLIQNMGAVLLWQFFGYWAFQHAGQKRELDQLKQIAQIEYNFKKWE